MKHHLRSTNRQILQHRLAEATVAIANGDNDDLNDLAEYVFGTDPDAPNQWPLFVDGTGWSIVFDTVNESERFIRIAISM